MSNSKNFYLALLCGIAILAVALMQNGQNSLSAKEQEPESFVSSSMALVEPLKDFPNLPKKSFQKDPFDDQFVLPVKTASVH